MSENQAFVEEEGLSLVDLIQLVLDNLVAIIVFVSLSVILGGIYTVAFEDAKYTAKASLIVQVTADTPTSEYTNLLVSEKLVKTFQVFMKSYTVLDEVAADLNTRVGNDLVPYEGNFTADWLKNATITNVTSSLIIEISWTDVSAQRAADIVNSIAEHSVSTSQNEEYVYLNNKLVILDPAVVPTVASKRTLLNIAISFIIGGLLSVLYIFLKEALSTKFKSAKEIEDYLKVPVLTSVPVIEK